MDDYGQEILRSELSNLSARKQAEEARWEQQGQSPLWNPNSARDVGDTFVSVQSSKKKPARLKCRPRNGSAKVGPELQETLP